MAEEIASIDINTSGALKAVDALIAQLRTLDKEIKEGQAAGKDMTAQQQQLQAATNTLNKALTQETQTLKAASAQATAASRAKKQLADTDAQLAASMRKTGEATNSSARLFARSAGVANSLKGSFLGAGKQILGVAAAFGPAGLAVTAFSAATDFAINALTEYFTKVDETTKFKEDFATATQGAIQSIVSETRASNGLFAELRDGNTTQERRREIVKQLNEQYPKIIGSTDLLTASETQLQKIQAQVNAGIRQRILAQAQEAQRAEIIGKIARNQAIIDDDLLKRGIDVVKTRQEEEAAINRVNTAYENEVKRLQELSVPYTEAEARRKASFDRERQLQELREKNAGNLDYYARLYSANAAEENRTLLRQLKTLGSTYEGLDATLSEFDFGAANTAELDKNTKKSTVSAKAAKIEQQALAGTLAALRAEQTKLNKALQEQTRLDNKTEIAKLGAELRLVNEKIKEGEEAIRAASEGDKIRINSISELRKAAQKLRDAIENEVDREDIAKLQEYNLELQKIEGQIKLIEQALAPTNNTNTFFTSQIDAAKISLAQLAQSTNAALSAVNTAEREALTGFVGTQEEREAIVKRFADQREKIELDAARRRAEIQLQIERIALDALVESGDATELQINEQIAAISELELKLTELGGKTFQAPKVKGIKEAVLEVAGYVEQVSNAVFGVLEAANSRAVAASEKAVAAQTAALDKLLSAEEGVSARQIDLEKERLEKLNDEREKAKNKEAIIAQAQIAINLALAVARAAAEGGGIASAITISAAIASAIVGFISAKQAAAQAFYDGTESVKANGSHVSDSFPPRPRGAHPKDVIPAYLSEDERVVSARINKAYRPILSAISNELIPQDVANGWVSDYLSPNGAASRVMRQSVGVGNVVNMVNVSTDGLAAEIVAALQAMPQTKVTERGIIHISQSGTARDAAARNRQRGW